MNLKQFITCGIGPSQARAFLDPISAAMVEFGICTPARQAAFLAQLLHESAGFTQLEENLAFTSAEQLHAVFRERVPSLPAADQLLNDPRALANRVYCGKNGNGDEASGDGWTYRRRGLIRLLGRGDYSAARADLGIDVVSCPDLVAQPIMASRTAARWWAEHGCNKVADAGAWDSITKIIDGKAASDARERREQTLANLQVLSASAAPCPTGLVH